MPNIEDYGAATLLTEHNYMPRLHELVTAARASIDLAIYLIAPPRRDRKSAITRTLDALAAAPARRVRCRLVIATPDRRHPDIALNSASCNYLTRAGWEIRGADPRTTMHSKLWIFDCSTSILGSHNLSAASLVTNVDTSILIRSPQFAAQLSNRFAEIWKNARAKWTPDAANG
jgi:phosphatidylserine/phosphatidylglycerophosphate/cardiolipin synthase-like enzyme